MAQVKQVEATESVQKIIQILEEDGCIVLKNAMDSIQLNKLKAELEPHMAQTPNCNGDFYGHKTKRVGSLIAKSAVCCDLAIKSVLLSVMDEFLLRSCKSYQLNLTQAIQIGPGEPQQMMHPDDPMFPVALQTGEKMINCMWAIDDFTDANGATHLVPGSHKWEREGLLPERVPEKDDITKGEMPAGSVLIYFGSLLHCGGANTTSTPRTGLVVSYCLGWLRQSENQYLAVSQEITRTLPQRLQELMGYFVHKPNLGQIEGRDPRELLLGKHIVNSGFEEFLPEEVRPFIEEHKKRLAAA
ncbi:MAG: hypothetical protein COB36_07905 [Alphaproteobacteria bacterium]|nr:MAG: hypothetical protein COB36_07905 [Alphaproteobacteria bacterium]